MAALTKQEILAQLENLGIISSPDITTYFQEYEEYSTLREVHSYSSQAYFDSPENK